MLIKNGHISIQEDEISMTAMRAQGAGGQNVNKVSSAIHLKFDINASSLSDEIKTKLLAMKDKRISKEGVVVIKAQRFRSQDKNRADALERLKKLILKAIQKPTKRIPTKKSKAAHKRRLAEKTKRSAIKQMRQKVHD